MTWLALQGFGGVLTVVQRELVEKKRWMTREEFVEEWAVAQIMPGPNVVNLSLMIGARYFGFKGAMAALAGMLTAPLVIVLLLALVVPRPRSSPTRRSSLVECLMCAGRRRTTSRCCSAPRATLPVRSTSCAAFLRTTEGGTTVMRS